MHASMPYFAGKRRVDKHLIALYIGISTYILVLPSASERRGEEDLIALRNRHSLILSVLEHFAHQKDERRLHPQSLRKKKR